ncbi:unnamed protein product [Prorocentrum cordatum]|uniref:EF-hand domain-containing protein n=1 Tax=Prorocentrum cordatum TaxID=2364126 RepID=A0ABN9Y771_9DINO|nr:unnamed protein product [Polarella glacialis]|mmetsp:Transcript_66959/g.174228  ORF Transcript_66959/g.174228 Transcript_66959/m.174228 type:complete len:198 (-) Transcript_66959:97-690(-)
MAAAASSNEEKSQAPSLTKLKKVIKDAFANFDKIGNNTIQADEVGTIMRYLGQFASESDLKETIIPELTDEGGSEGQISFEAFEKMMLRNLSEHVYDPDDGEMLLAAFRVLDPEGRGYIDSSVMHEHLSTRGGKAVDGFREREMADFLEYAKDKESADPNRIYYEDYVAKLTEDIERHLENLYLDARGNKTAAGALR